MAKNFKLANASKSLAANAVVDQFDDETGYIEIYDGTQPVSPDTAVSDQNLLCTVVIDAAFPAAVNGVTSPSSFAAGTVTATGTASWFRMYTSADAVVADGTVGATNDYDLTLTSTSLVENEEVASLTITYTQG